MELERQRGLTNFLKLSVTVTQNVPTGKVPIAAGVSSDVNYPAELAHEMSAPMRRPGSVWRSGRRHLSIPDHERRSKGGCTVGTNGFREVSRWRRRDD